jgi:hypothetical protein
MRWIDRLVISMIAKYIDAKCGCVELGMQCCIDGDDLPI